MTHVAGPVSVRKRPLPLARALAGAVARGLPYSVAKYPLARLARMVADECVRRPPDVVIAGAFLWDAVPQGPWRRIHDSHNIEHALWADFAAAAAGPKAAFLRREARLLDRQERRIWAEADAIIALSQEDAGMIRKAVPGAEPVVVPVRIAAPARPACAARRYDIGLLGAWGWAPNADAIAYFAGEIMPVLAERGLRVCVAGANLSAPLARRLTALGADCPGFVADLGAFYTACRLILAPYRKGGGVRMKVAEALSHGCPVAGTTLTFRGLPPPPDPWIGDRADTLIAAIEAMLRDGAAVPPDYGRGHDRAAQAAALAAVLMPTTPSGAKA